MEVTPESQDAGVAISTGFPDIRFGWDSGGIWCRRLEVRDLGRAQWVLACLSRRVSYVSGCCLDSFPCLLASVRSSLLGFSHKTALMDRYG